MKAVRCPSCGAPGVTPGKDCEYCGSLVVYERGELVVDELVCPGCQTVNRREVTYCRECGRDLYKLCFVCQTKILADAAHCGFCGAEQHEADGGARSEEAIDAAQAELIQQAARSMATFDYRSAEEVLEQVPAEQRSMHLWIQLAKTKAAIFSGLALEGELQEAEFARREALGILDRIVDQHPRSKRTAEANSLRTLLTKKPSRPASSDGGISPLALLAIGVGILVVLYFVLDLALDNIF